MGADLAIGELPDNGEGPCLGLVTRPMMGEVSNEHAHLNGWISTLLLMDCKEIKAINLRFKKPSMSDPHFFL